MFNRRISMMIGAAAMAFAASMPAVLAEPGLGGDLAVGGRPGRRGKGRNTRRGNGLQAKPKKRSNRLTISKRVRRKHRRAA